MGTKIKARVRSGRAPGSGPGGSPGALGMCPEPSFTCSSPGLQGWGPCFYMLRYSWIPSPGISCQRCSTSNAWASSRASHLPPWSPSTYNKRFVSLGFHTVPNSAPSPPNPLALNRRSGLRHLLYWTNTFPGRACPQCIESGGCCCNNFASEKPAVGGTVGLEGLWPSCKPCLENRPLIVYEAQAKSCTILYIAW